MENMIFGEVAAAVNPAEVAGSLVEVGAAGEDKSQVKQRKNPVKPAAAAAAAADTLEVDRSKEILWANVVFFIYLHLAALYGLYLAITAAKWRTLFMAYVLHLFAGMGVTAGAHRYWTHRTFKAKLPLQILLAVAQTFAFQNGIYVWCRDHRVHHKFSETDADPHNAKRGFFFAHMGWLMVRKHPEVIRKGATVDCSDLLNDPIVAFQHKYYRPLGLLISIFLPAVAPWYFWGESLKVGFFTAAIFRYVYTLHCTWLVNSAAHIWGNHPYDKNINPTENWGVAFLSAGEGWHNYHHTFPWDYKTAELGNYGLNVTTMMIDFFAYLGLAYDLKTVPDSMVRRRVKRTGDGSHPYSQEEIPPEVLQEEDQPHLDY